MLLLPIFIPVMIILRFTGEGEVFYRQERMGSNFQTFGMLKFATMLKDSLQMGNKTVTLRNDPRITSAGRFLRITKINELPQLWNVLVGDMSFVGPRPLLTSSYKKYSKEVQDRLSLVKPGITGIGSIVFRDEEQLTSLVRNLGGEPLGYYRFYIYPYKGSLETFYSEHRSLYTDFKILFITGWQLIFKDSNLVFKTFNNLPPKPISLTLDGIRDLDMSKVKEIKRS